MSPQRQHVVITTTLAVSVTTLIGLLVSALALGGKWERLDSAVSSSISIHDASMWIAQTERANTNWCGADIWDIWERNHAERKSIIGRVP